MSSKEVKVPLSQIDKLLFTLSERLDIEKARNHKYIIHKLIMSIFTIVKKMPKNDIRELRKVKHQIVILNKHLIFYSKLSNQDFPEFDMWIISIIKQIEVYEKKLIDKPRMIFLTNNRH